MKYSENELADLISEVETEFSKHLEKAEAGSSEKLEKNEEISSEVLASDEVSKKEEVSLDYSNEDVTEMNEMYASMNKSEKEAHYKSIKSAIFGNEEEVVVKDEMNKSEEVSKDEEVIAKSEDVSKISNLEEKLQKSEEDYEGLKKSFSELISKLTKNVKDNSAPKQKAVTKIEYIAKSEDSEIVKDEKKEDVDSLNKSEIMKRLTKKTRSNEITKSDRNAINEYCLTETKDIESIRHLL